MDRIDFPVEVLGTWKLLDPKLQHPRLKAGIVRITNLGPVPSDSVDIDVAQKLVDYAGIPTGVVPQVQSDIGDLSLAKIVEEPP